MTLRVNEWFKGDTGETTITANAPEPGWRSIEGEGSPSAYGPGTRVLLSGKYAGASTAYAWFGCGGFSRYYSESDARAWRIVNS